MAKRKPKQATTTQRRQSNRLLSNERVLIVCEGTKTEKHYFEDLRRVYGLSAVTLEVVSSSSGFNAKNILHDTRKRFERAKERGDKFTHVYCVFDRDDEYGANAGFRDVVNEIRKTKDFYAAYSIPSFEFWLLLYFTYTRQCFESSQQVFEKLQKHYKAYQKNHTSLFRELEVHLDNALDHADRCLQKVKDCDEHNPSTMVHELVRFLQKLRNEK